MKCPCGSGLDFSGCCEPFIEGEEYNNKAWKKFIIVMTDGDNDWGNLDSHNGSFYTGYGFVTQGRLGVTMTPEHVLRELRRRDRVHPLVEGVEVFRHSPVAAGSKQVTADGNRREPQ